MLLKTLSFEKKPIFFIKIWYIYWFNNFKYKFYIFCIQCRKNLTLFPYITDIYESFHQLSKQITKEPHPLSVSRNYEFNLSWPFQYQYFPWGLGDFTTLLQSLDRLSHLTNDSGDVNKLRVWWWLMRLRPRLSRARVNGLVRLAASHDFIAEWDKQQCNIMQHYLSGS